MIYGLAIRYIASGDPEVENGYCGFTATCEVEKDEYTAEHADEFVQQLLERVEGQDPAVAMWRRRPKVQVDRDFETGRELVKMSARVSWSNRKRGNNRTEWIVAEGAEEAVSIHNIPGSKTPGQESTDETCSAELVGAKGPVDDFSVTVHHADGRKTQIWP